VAEPSLMVGSHLLRRVVPFGPTERRSVEFPVPTADDPDRWLLPCPIPVKEG
jgi:hypothetical protein